ncbi:MAG: threonine--tRNA ligase [Candidatus Amesbacteria bacterium]|nr:threonine--tRNA ligase [Candidatus Amesbacteria bacterium]
MKNDLYSKLIALLDKHHAKYRLIDHVPEGRTEIVSPMRGNKLSQAAKCMVLTVNLGKKEIKYVLGVVPGDKQIDFNAIKTLLHASYVSFTPQELTEKLAQSVVGTVLPFSFSPELELIVDPSLLTNEEIFFNAARLDRSMALLAKDYVSIVKPRLADIAKSSGMQKEIIFGDTALANLRHSCAHLLAAAILDLYPKALPTLGPSIENGFYYDFDNLKISDTDLPAIEDKMHELVKAWKGFEKIDVELSDVEKRFAKNVYKIEMATQYKEAGLTLYKSGEFTDLCRGGHCEHPDQELKYFKLMSIAGAYWRGDEKNKMLTRIYGTCWPSQKELDNYLNMLEEAKKRDHRKLGKDLDLYSTNMLTGQGLILWHPKLAIVRNIVEDYWRKEHYKRGYQLVFTPHIASMDMFVKSRHLSKYINSMFPVMLHEFIEGESAPDYQTEELLKPMNCPNHIQIYNDHPRSYRELPMRIGELGTVYRYERAGVLHGMTRVRGFTQDDSHIFCAPEQVIDEVCGVLKLMKDVYALFGFSSYQVYISTRPEKYLGTLEMWDFAEESLKKAAVSEGFDYKIDEGEGVFYGPKIDLKVKDSIGREWQLGTVQFDFNQPANAETTEDDIDDFWKLKTFKHKFKTRENLAIYLKKLGRGFNVTYIDKDGKEKQCVMVHRVVFGSMERFFGILIEHYGGAFPVWLAPVQVSVLPISEKHLEYATKVTDSLKLVNIRCELDSRSESLGAKIRDAEMQKVPYILVTGDKEAQAQSVSVRTRGKKESEVLTLEEFKNQILDAIMNRK